MRYKSTFVLAVLMMCASFAIAHADVKYTRVVKTIFPKTSSEPSFSSEETDTFFVSPDKTRQEINYPGDNNSPPIQQVFITRCDLQQVFTIDDDLKIYFVSPVNQGWIPKSLIADGPVPKDIPEQKTIINFYIQKLAAQEINGFDTQGYSIEIKMQDSEHPDDAKAIPKVKIWVADVPGWQCCGSDKSPFAPSSFKPSSVVLKTHNGYRRSTIVLTGDVKEMNKITAAFKVRTTGAFNTLSGSDTGTAEMNVTSFERIKKLDDSLFEVPAGYRKVSTQEYYNRLQSRAAKTIQEIKKSQTH